jgi:8-oxo-dGTP diphosphatase
MRFPLQRPVQAAGGVVLRRQDGGPAEVALIHRPAYDDWTLPKGKLNPGETHEEAALREVKEETGLVCRLGDPAGQVEYRDRKGRPKVVRYWTMEPVGTTGGEFVPNDEVDRLRWVPLAEAGPVLTYDHDRHILESLKP